jgi:hypothetical protein
VIWERLGSLWTKGWKRGSKEEEEEEEEGLFKANAVN